MNKAKNLERFCLRVVKIGLFLTLLTPLIYSPITISISVFSAAIFFRILVEIIAFFWIILLFINRRAYLPRLSPILFTLIIFVTSMTVSSLLGFNPMRSFLGTLSRQEGLLTYFHLLLFFSVLSGVMKKPEDWLKLLRTSVIISIPVALAGISQFFSTNIFKGIGCLPPECWRISATMGNSGFYGNYLVVVIFVALFLATTEIRKGWKGLAVFLLILNGILLAINGTRAAWVGTGFGVMVFGIGWLLWIWKGSFSKRFIKIAGGIILGIGLLTGALLIFQKDRFKDNIILERSRDLISDIMNHENPRLPLWQVGIKAWKEHPFLGSGLESYMMYYDRFYEPRFQLYRVPEMENFDRAHNVYIDMLAMGGLLGLLSYLAIVVAAVMTIIKERKQVGPWGTLALLAFLASRSAHNFFSFDFVVTYVLLFMILAFVDSYKQKQTEIHDHTISWNNAKTAIALAGLAGVLISIVVFNFRPFRTSYLVVKGNNFFQVAQIEKAILTLRQALQNVNPWVAYDARRNVVKMFQTVLVNKSKELALPANQARREIISRELDLKILESEKHLAKGPEIHTLSTYMVSAEASLGAYLGDSNLEHIKIGKRMLQKALEINSYRPSLYEWLSMMEALEGRLEEALAATQKHYELWSDEGVLRQLQGKAYVIAGRNEAEKEKGIELFRESFKFSGFYTKEKFKIEDIEHLTKLYREVGNLKAIADLYEETIALYPKDLPLDVSLYQALEEAYKKLGQKKKAEEVKARLKALQGQ